MARDLRHFGQRMQFGERPRLLVVDQPGDLKFIGTAVHFRRFVFVIIGVERKRPGDGAVGESRRQLGAAEQRGLRAVVERRNLSQHALRGITVDDVAAGQKRQRTEASRAAQETAPRRIGHELGGILDQEFWIDARDDYAFAHGASYLPVTMARRLFGTSSANKTCTIRKPTIAAMAKKCT